MLNKVSTQELINELRSREDVQFVNTEKLTTTVRLDLSQCLKYILVVNNLDDEALAKSLQEMNMLLAIRAGGVVH